MEYSQQWLLLWLRVQSDPVHPDSSAVYLKDVVKDLLFNYSTIKDNSLPHVLRQVSWKLLVLSASLMCTNHVQIGVSSSLFIHSGLSPFLTHSQNYPRLLSCLCPALRPIANNINIATWIKFLYVGVHPQSPQILNCQNKFIDPFFWYRYLYSQETSTLDTTNHINLFPFTLVVYPPLHLGPVLWNPSDKWIVILYCTQLIWQQRPLSNPSTVHWCLAHGVHIPSSSNPSQPESAF